MSTSNDSCLSMEDVDQAKKVCIRLFTEHPRQADESYCQHFAYAAGTGIKLIGLGLVSVVHGLCPFLFTSTVSSYVPMISRDLEGRSKKVSSKRSESAFREYEPVRPVCPVAQVMRPSSEFVGSDGEGEEKESCSDSESSDSSISSGSHSHSD